MPKISKSFLIAGILFLLIATCTIVAYAQTTHSTFNATMMPRPLSQTTYQNVLALGRNVGRVSPTSVHIVWDNDSTTDTSFSPTTSSGTEYMYIEVPSGVTSATVTIVEGSYSVTFTPELPKNSVFTVKTFRGGNGVEYPFQNVLHIYRDVLIKSAVAITVETTVGSPISESFVAATPRYQAQEKYVVLPNAANAITLTINENGVDFIYPLTIDPIVPTPTPMPTPAETPISGVSCDYWQGRPDLREGWVYGYLSNALSGVEVVAKLNETIVGCTTTQNDGLMQYTALHRLSSTQTEGEFTFWVNGTQYIAEPSVSVQSMNGDTYMITLSPKDAPTPTFVPTEPTSTSEATPTGDVTSTPGATPTEGATATDTPAATPTEGATATNTPVATPTLVASPTSPVQPTNTPVPSTGWLEIQPAAISHTVEYVSAPLVITWAVKNVSGQATSFTAIMLQPVGKACFTNPSFQSALAVGETKAFSSTVSSTCLGAGTHSRSYQFVEQVPISATPRNANLPIQITVLPNNPWEVKIAVPGAISATMPATYTMVVKNVGDRVRLGSAQVYVDSSPFAITPTVQVNAGEIHASPFGTAIRYLWAFEIAPGETATFTSGGISKDIPTFTLYPDVWRWQSPDLSSGAAALAVFPQGQTSVRMVYLPVIVSK